MVPSAVATCSYVEKICERKVGIPRSTTGKHNGEYGVKCSVSFAGVECFAIAHQESLYDIKVNVGLLVASTMLCLSHVVGLFLCVIYKIKSPPRED